MKAKPKNLNTAIASIFVRICGITLLIFAMLIGTQLSAQEFLRVYTSAPGMMVTNVTGGTVTTETFSSFATVPNNSWAPLPNGYASSIGNYYQTLGQSYVKNDDQYGAGTGKYMAVKVGGKVNLVFNSPQRYFGFAWPAGDGQNTIKIIRNGQVIGTFATSNVVALLPKNPSNFITAINGTQYSTFNYYGKPGTGQTAHEPYAYLHFYASSGLAFTEVEFSMGGGGEFENDNHSIVDFDPTLQGDWVELISINTPTASDDSGSGMPGQPVTINVLANDVPGSAPIVPATVQIDGTNGPGQSLTVPGQGVWSVNTTTGAITFTPAPGFIGSPTPIKYFVKDQNGFGSNLANVIVTYPVGPTAVDDNATTNINTPVTINIIGNDVAGTNPLVASSISFVAGTQPNPATVGTFVNNGNGTVTFNPAIAFTGTATIDYQICDAINLCDVATITVTINSVTGPTANDDNASTTAGVPVDISVLSNDTPGSAPLNPAFVTLVPGTAPDPVTVGTFIVNGTTGVITFNPVSSFTGTATVSYQVCDQNGLCDQAVVTVVVNTAANCELTKNNGGGFQTTIVSVVDDCQKVTIKIRVKRTGPGQNLSHYAIQASAGTYSNVSVSLLPGTTMNYVLDLGPNLGSNHSFTGFKVDDVSGFDIGEGFEVTYSLSSLQSQQMVAKAGQGLFTAAFTISEFEQVMNCAGTTCGGGNIGNVFPATGPGTLAYEDLWPGKGDYDFNDMVIDYQFEIISTQTNMVEKVTGTFTLKAFGASFENGFGFQFPNVAPDGILSVTGHQLTDGIITLSANGTEAGQSKATFILFDNAFAHMPHPGIGIGVNTTPGAPYVLPVTFTMVINFKPNTVSMNDLNIGNFNPFIIVNKVRGHEVHLPFYPPTDLVDMSLFGQWEDDSNPSANRWYVTDKNLPWAINIYESFAYPVEKQDILGAHLKFAEWAMSGGVQFPDWYKNLPGYRNSSVIYQIP